MAKHKPYDEHYASYLLYLLNTDPQSYGSCLSQDDWLWYRDEAVVTKQYVTAMRRFSRSVNDGHLPGHEHRREEWKAAQRPAEPSGCAGDVMTLDPMGLLIVAKHSHFHRWLHDLRAEGRLEELRCCPKCARFFYAEHGQQRFCSEEARRSVPAKPRTRPASYYRERRADPVIASRRKLREIRRTDAASATRSKSPKSSK